MVAANYPLIGKCGALNFSDDVVNRFGSPIRFHFEVNFRGAGADVIGDGEAAAPLLRSHPAAQRSKKWLRVGIGDRQHRNFGNRGSVFHLQTFGVFRGSNVRCEGVARIVRHVGDAAALDSIGGTICACRKGLPFDKSVFMRVGVDQAANGTVLGGNLGLDAAPGVEVARNDDFALDGDAHALELLVVFGDSVVDVDEGSGNIAVDRVGIVGGKLLSLLTG